MSYFLGYPHRELLMLSTMPDPSVMAEVAEAAAVEEVVVAVLAEEVAVVVAEVAHLHTQHLVRWDNKRNRLDSIHLLGVVEP